MLRTKALSEKVILLGLDGLDPKFSRKMVDEGHMPNLKKIIEKGSARNDHSQKCKFIFQNLIHISQHYF